MSSIELDKAKASEEDNGGAVEAPALSKAQDVLGSSQKLKSDTDLEAKSASVRPSSGSNRAPTSERNINSVLNE